ncbi:type IV secretion system DNA-binding domain-containing protein [Sphingorhabdus lacus]|uniref:Conjugal transfer protein TraD n=1 Tax=Sphingorhabdus lacus TaxID=392610 RepID=A0A6I6LEB5_9SPHN|nr:type IV secretion system DNA-binding domain-containing protein [Sphingorhabdus lacus]QGY80782.1 conjugal transfer protein TraD [Sphingorhabdus lacus]
MKRNLLNFTRGSQLLGHFGFMFAAGLKGPLIVAAMVIGGMCWWTLSGGLSTHETYLVWMRIYAAIYGFMEFDPAKLISIETGLGGTVELPLGTAQHYPPIMLAWEHMLALLKQALTHAALLLVPTMIAFYWFASHFGSRSKERKHERGAMLATLTELVAEIGEHNARERKRELSEALGIKWRYALPGELRRLFPYAPSHLAQVSYPWRLEQSHAMLIGTTGMGKTVALSDMIEEARASGQRAVIFDLTGTFIEHFYESDRDIILNPLDARCPQWSVFDECRDEAEFSAAAEALVPHDGGGSEQFWVLAARLLFVEMCLKLRAKGSATNEALASELMTADLTQVHKLMRGTIADPLTAPEAARMAESIRAVFNANAKALKLLPRSGPQFSVRNWVESDKRDGSMLYISARYIDMSVCSQLLTVWLDTAMNTLMAMDRTRDLRLWFFIDEMGALHRLPALEKGLQTARNFGGAIVTGIHAYAKLKEVYGDNMAMTLSSLARTKLILGTADRETATWCSDFIGHTQVRDMEEGYTYGYNNARDAVSLTPRKNIEPLLLPDQLMNLPRLSGYLKFPDGFPAAPVKLVPVSRKKRAQPFIRRAGDDGPPNRSHPDQMPQSEGQTGTDEHPSSNDDGAGKRVVPKQGELALTEKKSGLEHERAAPDHQPHPSEAEATTKPLAKPEPLQPDEPDKNAAQPQIAKPDAVQPAIPTDKVLRVDAPSSEGQDQLLSPGSMLPSKPALQPQHKAPEQGAGKADAARRLMLEDGMREREEAKHAVDLGDLDMDL